jgi:hypothetical protein
VTRPGLSAAAKLVVGLSASLAVSTFVRPVEAATFTIINGDAAGEGFNDATPALPVGGNTGTTVGEQRLIAFQYAADLWGARIDSDIAIRVEASFDELECNSFGAVLGAAGPRVVNRDFAGAPLPGTWYPPSLANVLAGSDINPGTAEILAYFNSRLGQPNCLAGTFFYYGLDGNEGVNIDFVTVLTHELGHGLGFLSLVNPSTGQELSGFTDVFSNFLEDHSTGNLFPDMTDFERAVASVDGTQSTSGLHSVGPTAIAAGDFLTSGRHSSGHLLMYAPNPVEPGSSVSHWAKVMTPNQMMEPSFTNALHNIDLELALFADLGYPRIFPCGDATQDEILSASDALFALNVSVGLGSCIETLCDVNGSGTTTSTDALAILSAGVGLPVTMSCGLS